MQDLFGGKKKRVSMINVIDLNHNLQYLNQYIELRNKYKDKLFTKSVNYEETKKWIKNNFILIKIAIKNEILLGVVVLYLNKNNEITIFTKEESKGIGSLLLIEIEKYALKNNIKYIYSWVEQSNEISKALFFNQNFLLFNESIKKYNDIEYIGNIFQKELSI